MADRFILSLLVTAFSLSCTLGKEASSPPYIVKQPPTDEVLFQVESGGETDKPFYIECEAIGEPAPKYRWVKNGKPFHWQTYDDRISQQQGRGTLSISKPTDVDLGQYQCFAENEHGVATSNSVFMRKAELNSFKTTQPISLSGDEGEPFKLTCEPPDGWPKPIVHWIYLYTNGGFKTINSSRMTIDPEGNLWFSNLTRDDVTDNFKYACAATSPFKHEYKYGNSVLLNVVSTGVSAASNKREPVLQYVSRKNTVAYLGKQQKLYCIFGGTPLPQTVWYKDGKPIQSSDRITQDNYGKSLVIRVVNFEDEGKYTCEVSNGVGEAKSYSIDLKVFAIPYFIAEPERQNAAEGETVEFRCEAGGVPKPEIKWIHNGKPISEAPPNPRRRVENNRIVIERLVESDTGNYGCNATNSLGYVYKDVYVNVLSLAPEILEAPTDTQAVDGQNVTMICKVLGAPKPSIKWSLNERELTGGRYIVQPNGDLIIRNVQFDDRGNYTCFAENKFGNASAKAALLVKSHTYITDGPEDYEVAAHTSATFRCNAVSDDSLDLEIIWLKNDQPIDLEEEPRFVRSSDYSLTITQTIELDSGTYTCVARTALDEASAKAQLIVQDVPNPPSMEGVECHAKDATIRWKSMGDNRAPISHYIIEYNTTFTPETWTAAYNNVPATDMSYNVPMSPWTNYTFRVIAVNKIGKSLPSTHSDVCTTEPDVPYKNPDDVKGEGDRPDNLIISWTPMPKIEHNADKFQYRVYWRRDIPGERYESRDITDWRVKQFVVDNQPTFQQYRIKVVAMNEKGEANVAPKEVIGYSGENIPIEAPTNFTLLQIQGPKTALLSWNPVDKKSVQGHLKGYKIKTWSDISSPMHNEIQVQGSVAKALVDNLDPYTMNYAQVFVYNGKYNGPPSETLSFKTPEGVPEAMSYLEAYPLGAFRPNDATKTASSAFLLTWKKPEKPNGMLTGYDIYYRRLDDSTTNSKIARNPQIRGGDVLSAKLSGLEPDTNYVIYIAARTSAGPSKEFYIERRTSPSGASTPPGVPDFDWETVKADDDGKVTVRIQWRPDKTGNPGSHFIVKYKREAEPNYEEVEVLNDDFVEIPGIAPRESYDFKVTSVDGDYYVDSKVKTINIYSDGPLIKANENMASAGWFIGMMLAIAILLLILIVVCIIKRNRGGKYAVHEREQANGRHDYPDEGGFHEYSQPLDNKSHGRASMSSEPKVGPESDTDSMAEYGDGDTGRFTEDGSFIGQYVPSNMKQLGPPSITAGVNNNALATYV
ncbi:neuroglian isoform X4 [Tribolium castaneum]|nr:PREDICTED: neuroglian isoform X3 [Tribolium castaneum]|eukprot:XP_008200376.1 PREDICTED: neuroglian isoform X3 [Tribolium castaneum]